MPQPVPPVPGIPAGYGPLPADLTLWVTDSFSFLAQPPVFRAQLQAAQALTGAAFNGIHYDTVLEDPYGGWSATATGSQPAYSWLCPAGAAGWYDITLAGFANNQGGSTDHLATAVALNGALWSNGSEDWAPNGADGGSCGSVQVPLLPGDYVQFLIYLTVSVSTPATAGQYPSAELAWVSS